LSRYGRIGQKGGINAAPCSNQLLSDAHVARRINADCHGCAVARHDWRQPSRDTQPVRGEMGAGPGIERNRGVRASYLRRVTADFFNGGRKTEGRHTADTLALAGLIAYDVEMISTRPFQVELLDLLHTHEANLHERGRSTDRFRFNGVRGAIRTAGMLTETEKTSIWRRRSKIYQTDRLAQEIGL
jgi:hypothetical protein